MSEENRDEDTPGLLCVANFGAGTGFAWTFIERIYADVADRMAARGIDTRVAYPELEVAPAALRDSAARPVEQAVRLDDPAALGRLVALIRRHGIRVLYLADRPVWHPAYALLRAAGVRWIVVHDHTSGERTRPSGLKRMLKDASRRAPGMLADRVIGVSDFVARRKVEVDLVPPERVERVWNAVQIPPERSDSDRLLASRLGLSGERTVIACACRASEEKGVHHLLRAFARIVREADPSSARPLLVYMGDGPALGAWRSLAVELGIEDDVVFTGYREDADELVGGAAVAVVPSVWAEAFGLAALEPMAWGVPVVASDAGGLPEVVADGETGVLVPPGNESALAGAIHGLLTDGERRREMGRAGRRRAVRFFAWENQIASITRLLKEGLS